MSGHCRPNTVPPPIFARAILRKTLDECGPRGPPSSSQHARIERPAGRLWRPPSCGFHCVLEDPERCAYSRKGADFHCHPHSCRAHSSLQKIYIVSRIQGFTQSRSLATNGFTGLGNSPPNVFLNWRIHAIYGFVYSILFKSIMLLNNA